MRVHENSSLACNAIPVALQQASGCQQSICWAVMHGRAWLSLAIAETLRVNVSAAAVVQLTPVCDLQICTQSKCQARRSAGRTLEAAASACQRTSAISTAMMAHATVTCEQRAPQYGGCSKARRLMAPCLASAELTCTHH